MNGRTEIRGKRRWQVVTGLVIVAFIALVSVAPQTSGATSATIDPTSATTAPSTASTPSTTAPPTSPSASASSASSSRAPTPPVVPPAGSAYLGALVGVQTPTQTSVAPTTTATTAPSTTTTTTTADASPTTTAPTTPAASPGTTTSTTTPSAALASPPSSPTVPGNATTIGSTLHTLDTGLARPVSIIEVNQSWNGSMDMAVLRRIVATGAIPMITWSCGDTDVNVAAGVDDALVSGVAHQLTTLGAPVLLRWFPDPNAQDATTLGCLGTGGATTYAAAFQHVRQLVNVAGATNVGTVWSVDTSQGSSADWSSYYPGSASTDWIAADAPVPSTDPFDPGSLAAALGPWYSAYSTYGKPLLVSNTGVAAGSQQAFLQEVGNDLPNQFPLIKGLVYSDAPEGVAEPQLDLDAAGLAAFQALAALTYFQPPLAPTTVTAATSEAKAVQGSPSTIKASVSGSDLGGSVTFSADGAVVAGCSGLMLADPVTCTTSSLPIGTDSIVATYGGDAAFASSSSAPVPLTIEAADGLARPVAAHPVLGSEPPLTPPPPTCTGVAPTAGATVPAVGIGHKPAVPGPCSAYLGLYGDRPSGKSSSGQPLNTPLSDVSPALAAVGQGLSRPASIIHFDLPWTPVETRKGVETVTNETEIDWVHAQGAIPMITWACNEPISNITNGDSDRYIKVVAQSMADTGVPILLRWNPDPNGVKSYQCGGGNAELYERAFKHIVLEFRAEHADNVGFVWSIDTDRPDIAKFGLRWTDYYPGNDYVDWIAADGFIGHADVVKKSSVIARFGTWYSDFSLPKYGKPLMIAGTGAPGASAPGQATYLALLAQELPSDFPAVKAVVFSDAQSNQGVWGSPDMDTSLTGPGQTALDELSAAPFFQPIRATTTATVSSSDAAPPYGKVLVLTATVNGSDVGGSETFLDNGSPIPGCQGVAVLNGGSCETSSLAPGHHRVEVSYSGDAVSGPARSTYVEVDVGKAAAFSGRPYIPPVGKTYLGAWVRPLVIAGTGETALQQELSQLPTFNGGLVHHLAVVHVYQKWLAPPPLHALQGVLANGGTPMVDWTCGDTNSALIGGHDDALIKREATALAALKSPVFLRWFYEFNFTASHDYRRCMHKTGLGGPRSYILAFQHIHQLFLEAGATNVAFVWCVASAGDDTDWIKYYPGAAADWIGVDGYMRTSTGGMAYKQGEFTAKFGPWYQTLANMGKPLMITETGATTGQQAPYLSELESSIDTTFPLIRGVLYFDAPGKNGTFPYQLDQPGYKEFRTLSSDLHFQPPTASSVTSLTSDATTTSPGQPVKITAKVQTDAGGSVSYFSNGSPIPGCQSIPVYGSTTCTTVTLPTGTDALTASYSGDAQFANSSSTPVSVQLSAAFAPDPSTPTLPALAPVPAIFPFAGPVSLPFAGPATTSPDPVFVAAGPPGNAIDLWGTITGGHGFGKAAVLGFGILALLGLAYMAVTWARDERVKRRLPES